MTLITPLSPLVISLGWTALHWLPRGLFANIPQRKQTADQLYEFRFNIILSCLLFSKPADCKLTERCLFLFSVFFVLFICKMQIRAKLQLSSVCCARFHDETSEHHSHSYQATSQFSMKISRHLNKMSATKHCSVSESQDLNGNVYSSVAGVRSLQPVGLWTWKLLTGWS